MNHKRHTLAIALMLATMLASTLAQAAERHLIRLDSKELHGGPVDWSMMKSSDTHATGTEISSVGFDCKTWARAAVPATVLTNLVRQGVYPEPYFGQNNKLSNNLIPDLANAGREFYTYWFRTEFDVPSEYKGRRIWLEPEGINYRAEVWVNGHLIGNMSGMFNSQSYDITDRVKAGEKAALAIPYILLTCQAPACPRTGAQPESGTTVATDGLGRTSPNS